ncbi:MAG: glycosyltransferase family 2 protein [Planctomycetes bacterium]|nr:glycosyltransferase family 2 protein [Planctomycetota bacterium]
MKLVSLSMVRNEEYWIWYALTSVAPHVDEVLVFDNHSDDRTVEIVRGMGHLGDKLTLFEGFGGDSEQENREQMLAEARRRGATHVLTLDGDEVYSDEVLGFCRRLLEVHEHSPGLPDPPRNHGRPLDPTPTDGILIKNIGLRPICPGFAGPGSCRPVDYVQSDLEHGAYNYLVRITSLQHLRGNGLEWGEHGFVETDDLYIQSSPHTLWLPGMWFLHFSRHPRSSRRGAGSVQWQYGVADQGSVPIHAHVSLPAALLRPDGPGNPTLEAWGMRDPQQGRPRARLADFVPPAALS